MQINILGETVSEHVLISIWMRWIILVSGLFYYSYLFELWKCAETAGRKEDPIYTKRCIFKVTTEHTSTGEYPRVFTDRNESSPASYVK